MVIDGTRQIQNYRLKITAGPSRDTSTHKPVPVNTEKPLHFSTEHLDVDLYVRVQNLRGEHHEPSTSPYFSAENGPHKNDMYSISFSPLKFKSDVGGDDLVLGNDFDHPINKQLPPGFGVAWRVARWVVDPGLDGDPWAEKPWLEGRVLSSVNALGAQENVKEGAVLAETFGKDLGSLPDEGGEIPKDAVGRMKFFLDEGRRKKVVFEAGKKYAMDFYNPYIDFNQFALKLPGVSIKILKYWDGQPLRYVLKNRVDQTVYLVVQFMLVERDDVEQGDSDEEASDDSDFVDEHAGKEEERIHRESMSKGSTNTNDDDVD